MTNNEKIDDVVRKFKDILIRAKAAKTDAEKDALRKELQGILADSPLDEEDRKSLAGSLENVLSGKYNNDEEEEILHKIKHK